MKKNVIKKQFLYTGATNAYIFKRNEIQLILLHKNYFWGCHSGMLPNNDLHWDLAGQGCATLFFKTKKIEVIKKKKIFFSNLFFFFKKFKFKGKGYKIKKSKIRNTLKFFFGFSHKKILFIGALAFKKIKKFKFIAISTRIKPLLILKNFISGVKPLDLYTKRGLRLSRQITRKRPGKKKTY